MTVKFISINRTICPRTQIHYLDAIDENGMHWSAEMSPNIENWWCSTRKWRLDPQQPQ